VNVFDIEHSDLKEHFLRFMLLHYLTRFSTESGSRGYVHIADVYQYLATYAFSRTDVDDALEYLYEKRCLRCQIEGLPWTDHPRDIRVTSLGRYHVTNLVNTFQYIDAMIVDTAILDSSLRDSLTTDVSIEVRVARSERMLDYLDRAVEAVGDAQVVNEWLRSSEAARKEIEEIRKRLGSI